MKIVTRISTVLALVAFVAALTFPLATSAEPGPAPAKSAITSPVPPPHPEIDDAMRLLNQAQDHLNHAAHDFGGHRVKAMDHISKALEELRAAKEYANHH
ncbi:MAG TPA: hypothetical protein VGS59_05675 [Candidatus Acidoferrales bacterium]|nr:hypothetical protein [Candidatus Acidoferrales bacterium]